jgi:hypothetical protein
MQNLNNVVDFGDFKQNNQQALLDDIGARAYLFLREEAEQHGLDLRQVMAEHILGLALVMEAIDGEEATKSVLTEITSKIG